MGCSQDLLEPVLNPCAGPPAVCIAAFKSSPEDFVVAEQLPFEPGSVGEHLYLQIEKVAVETPLLAQRLSAFYGVAPLDVGFAGLKDKCSVARQWFSIRTPSDLAPAGVPGVRVIGRGRHPSKLRRGGHSGNDFVIRLRDVRGVGWRERLCRIRDCGVPNYFGSQRFAPHVLDRARNWLLLGGTNRRYRHRSEGGRRWGQGWFLTVLRSFLFNEVLASRVRAGNWDQLVDGDVASSSDDPRFACATGPLWGRGRSAACADAAHFEQLALAGHQEICHGLEFSGMRQQRRSLVLTPQNFRWCAEGSAVRISFSLAPGGYATSLLREAFVLNGIADGI